MPIGLIIFFVLAFLGTIFFSMRDPDINPNAPRHEKKKRRRRVAREEAFEEEDDLAPDDPEGD